MSLFSPAELADMQAVWLSSLDTTCVLYPRSLTSDGAGGYTESWSAGSPVACRVQPALVRPTELMGAGREQAVDYWDIQLPAGTSLQAADQIVSGGSTYQVEGVTTGRSNQFGVTARAVRVI